MPKSLFILIISLSFFKTLAQKNIDPTPEDISLATELKKKYEDSKISLTKSQEEISFNFNKKTKKVEVIQKVSEVYMNLEARNTIPFYIFYDNESTVKNNIVSYRNNGYITSFFKDEYYQQDDLFHTDQRVKWTSLNFPSKGFKFKFKYTKKYKDVKYFISSYFDSGYPTIEKNITIHIPSWLNLEIKQFNLDGFTIKESEEENIKKGIKTKIFTLKNIAPVQKNRNAPGPTHFRPHLLFLAKSITIDNTTTQLLNNTKDLYKWYHSLVNQLEDNPELLKEKTLDLIKECKTDTEKIKKIYYWVQDNIRYIAFEDGIAGFKPDESQNVYKKKYGDCKGMANLTKQMLILAGFDARLTWIGTKRIAYDYSIPTIAVDNHMICTVIDGDKKYYLDSTEKYNPLDFYAERIQNKQVLIEDGENYILDKVPEYDATHNLETFTGDFVIEEELLKGEIKRSYQGESKSHFLYNINNLKTDRREETIDWFIRGNDKNITLEDIRITDITDRDGDLDLQYKIKQKNSVSSFDDELYIDLDYYKDYGDLDFKKRKIDYLHPYKISEKTILNLKIPDGYKVKELPENIAIKNDDFDVSISFKTENNIIVYQKIFEFKTGVIHQNQIENWKEFNKTLKKYYQQQIILSKG